MVTGHAPFPTSPQLLLVYGELRLRGGAKRTTLSSLLASLKFLEEAGEVEAGQRLSLHQAVLNAAKEAALTTAPGGPQKTKQAPPLLLRQIIALEGVVCALERKAYERGFAWFRLFRHWSGMRWDDSQGLKPDSLEIRARGVVGTLERTKTSGPGKKIILLPVFVSTDAYLVLPWLLVGLALWKEEPLNFDRDFFLPLPTEDLQGAKHIRARYTDSAGFSSALLRSLHDEQNLALLPGLSGNFWTEHSDRAGLDGWAAALGVRESERGFLGRWAAKSSSDRYVRTACRVVENIQVLTARFAKKSLAGGPRLLRRRARIG